MIGTNFISNKFGSFSVITYGLELDNNPSFLILKLVEFILDCIGVHLRIGYIFNKVLPSVVLIMMIVLYFIALISNLTTSS